MFKQLIKWSHQYYSHLPWRVQRSTYNTLVSEIMLQQTTVGTVLKHFEPFIKKLPTIKALAKLSEEEVCFHWQGLGYYRRARNLLAAAKEIQTKHRGEIPLKIDELIKIRGIGIYTANAIVTIGGNRPGLAVDGNLERVLSRVFLFTEEKGPKLQKAIHQAFKDQKIFKEMKKLGPRDLNEALMDLGREVCLPKNPRCEECPLKSSCQARIEGRIHEIPLQRKKKEEFFQLDLVRLVVKKKNKILVYKKSESEWLSGQYELPTFILKSQDGKLKQYPQWPMKPPTGKKFKTGITKYKISNTIIELSESEFEKMKLDQKAYTFIECKPDKYHFATSVLKTISKI